MKKKGSDFSNIEDVTSQRFSAYGNVLSSFPTKEAIGLLEKTNMPTEENVYIASFTEWKQIALKHKIERDFFGGMPVQLGYCNGYNRVLNGLEYHKGSEINVLASDAIYFLARLTDVENHQIDSTAIKGFYVPKGTAIELYQTTLHLAPCPINDRGFKCMVILPDGTNKPLEEKSTDPLLFMKNKWLFAHKDAKRFVENGAHIGFVGPRPTV